MYKIRIYNRRNQLIGTTTANDPEDVAIVVAMYTINQPGAYPVIEKVA